MQYRLIDRKALLSCCGITDPDEFRTYYKLVEYTLKHGGLKRESLWASNLAVGSRQYIEHNRGTNRGYPPGIQRAVSTGHQRTF